MKRPAAPLLPPAHAAMLLDNVIYQQVLECVDLDALYRIEQSLVMQLGDLGGVDVHVQASTMIDRALLRLPGDLRSYLSAVITPFRCDLCELFEDDDRPAVPEARPRASPASGRLGS